MNYPTPEDFDNDPIDAIMSFAAAQVDHAIQRTGKPSTRAERNKRRKDEQLAIFREIAQNFLTDPTADTREQWKQIVTGEIS